MAKIKICGLRREEDVSYVNTLKPDYVGFILTNGFRRSIDFETAKILRKQINKDVKVVGVFVNETSEYINNFVDSGIIDIAQLHGEEDTNTCKRINCEVIKVFKPENFDKIQKYESVANYYLFDSGTGSGKTFEWSKIPKVDKPFFLAGGIDSSNIVEAIRIYNPYAIDVSSSVETDGYKDFNKIKQIMELVRNE